MPPKKKTPAVQRDLNETHPWQRNPLDDYTDGPPSNDVDSDEEGDGYDQSRPWNVFDDISSLSELVTKLSTNWITEDDKGVMRRFFRQCANEV